jgi:hypothetical protein
VLCRFSEKLASWGFTERCSGKKLLFAQLSAGRASRHAASLSLVSYSQADPNLVRGSVPSSSAEALF